MALSSSSGNRLGYYLAGFIYLRRLGACSKRYPKRSKTDNRESTSCHSWLPNIKALGPDMIPKEAIKLAVNWLSKGAVVTLDVKNAFNSAPWVLRDAALQRSSVPIYLIKILKSYMCGRQLILGNNAAGNISVLCGVPQGFVLGPTLWNLFYDSVIRLEVPSRIILIAIADDFAVVTVAYNTEVIETLINRALFCIVQ